MMKIKSRFPENMEPVSDSMHRILPTQDGRQFNLYSGISIHKDSNMFFYSMSLSWSDVTSSFLLLICDAIWFI